MSRLRCVRPGLWRSEDGRWEVIRRDDADVARREWVLRDDGFPIDYGLDGHIDWPTLREAKEYIAMEEAS